MIIFFKMDPTLSNQPSDSRFPGDGDSASDFRIRETHDSTTSSFEGDSSYNVRSPTVRLLKNKCSFNQGESNEISTKFDSLALCEEQSCENSIAGESKLTLSQKMEAAFPYNFFLTTVRDSPKTHNELLSISFAELLDPYFGIIETSLQLNCHIHLQFLLSQYHSCGYNSQPLTLIYTWCDTEIDNKLQKFITCAEVEDNDGGSQHTKMMIFRYTNKSIRIVVLSANITEAEWRYCTQGLWISPECPALPPGIISNTAGESITYFKRDLLEYLGSYDLPCMEPWIEWLRQVDMSAIKVHFVGSVPGRHPAREHKWGHKKLSKLLERHVAPNNGQVIAQPSNIGGLGRKENVWLHGEFLKSLSKFAEDWRKPVSQNCLPIKVIFPTYNTIANSCRGISGGWCLLYNRSTHMRQQWLKSYLYDWASYFRHRTKAPPHIKTYCRISDDNRRLYYFVLTSANTTLSAWGKQSKEKFCIRNFEGGILFSPRTLVSMDYFPLEEEENGVKPFPLPFDLPLVPYGHGDQPWLIDHLRDSAA